MDVLIAHVWCLAPVVDESGLIARRVSVLLSRLATEEPVIALHGPRSVGKSTVLQILARDRGVPVIDLDDIESREAVAGNLALVTGGPAPLCVDEYQRVPDVLDAIKARLNREGSRAGTAVITGSTRQDALPTTAQALTGRLHTSRSGRCPKGSSRGPGRTSSRVFVLIRTPLSRSTRPRTPRGRTMPPGSAPVGCRWR